MTAYPLNASMTLTVAAAEYPVTLSELKLAARIDGTDHDSLLADLIAASTELVERETGRALVTQTWRMETSGISGRVAMRLPKAPVQSLTEIAYYDADGVLQTVDTDDFSLFDNAERPMIMPVSSSSWPTLQDRPDALRITFVAGYGAASAVPARLRNAVLRLADDAFEHPVATTDRDLQGLPFGVQRTLDEFRLGWFAA